MHAVVGLLQALLVNIEGVGVLHDEFTRAHYTETRSDFVAEFCLDLVIVDRQLLVAAQLTARDIGDDFFVCRAETIITIVAILHA